MEPGLEQTGVLGTVYCPSQRDLRASRTYYPKEHDKVYQVTLF